MLTWRDLRDVTGALPRNALPRPASGADEPLGEAQAIVDAVRLEGDAAVRRYTERYDGVHLADFRVPEREIARALERTEPALRVALRAAHANILAYHRRQIPAGFTQHGDGVQLTERFLPVEAAGCYVPGGRAVYPSTALMTTVPAMVAGVGRVALVVPPGPDGRVPDLTLAAAATAGVTEVYGVNGPCGVAALAYGTETIPAVDVIVGPGNVYIALVKRLVQGRVRIDSEAGPSELLCIVDETARPDWVAGDLAAQAEHGPNGSAVAVSWHEPTLRAVCEEIPGLVAASPRRLELEATLGEGGWAVLVRDAAQAVEVANAFAPEHLQIMTADPDSVLDGIRNAGAVFVGQHSTVPLGDYYAGPNHVLPTGGQARFASPLGVLTFMRSSHIVRYDGAALAKAAEDVAALATGEGLVGHAAAVRMRVGA